MEMDSVIITIIRVYASLFHKFEILSENLLSTALDINQTGRYVGRYAGGRL